MNVIETFIATRKELRDRGEYVSKEVVATLTLAEAVLRVGHHLEMAIDGMATDDMCDKLVEVAKDLTGGETQANENARETQALADKLEADSACEDDQ